MADEIPISGLDPVTTAQLTDVMPVVQGGTTYKSSNQKVLDLFNTISPFLGSMMPGAYVATTVDLGAVFYTNGTGGVGSYLLGPPTALVINGMIPPVNSYVLVNAQSNAVQNGLYQVVDSGGPSAQWRLNRPAFYDNSDNGKIRFGNLIFVQHPVGLNSIPKIYYLASSNGSIPVIGTTALNYAELYTGLNSPQIIDSATLTVSYLDCTRNTLLENGCNITINLDSLMDGTSALFVRAAGAGVVQFLAGTATVHFAPSGCNKLIENGVAEVKNLDGVYYVNGDLTA